MSKAKGIRDIAKEAGVSVATVSRVMNMPDKVSKETREKVKSVILKNNYIPNIQSKNIFNQDSHLIGIFVLDLRIPFFTELIRLINTLALKNGYSLLIFNTENDTKREKEYLELCRGLRTKGLIITEGHSSAIYNIQNPSQVLVFHDRCVDNRFPSVMSDNEQGVKMLTDYLYNLNHRKFAFVGYTPEFKSIRDRKIALTKELRDKDIELPDKNIFTGDPTTRTGVDACDYICTLENRPTAIICANDSIARGFIMRASKIGLKIPDDFSVVGFDGYSPEYFYPHLTTVKQDVEQTAKCLIDAIINPSLPPEQPRHCKIPVTLVVGDSCKKI